ncbi:C40 family peptidase [uncultured Imperialibacter sp.]|uniref:C40 family peptidase n=1 Tax=uncultured Imperialibacter sp. TaxID=1672639 RepID=UPI0030DC3025|tara:strand:+ start:2531 stop:3727 length:1197 start_codon:yes stop_codon:yes gene_type:complete
MTKYIKPFFIIVALSAYLAGCKQASKEQKGPIADEEIAELRLQFAPDKRVALFQVASRNEGSKIVLTGETNIPEAKAALLDSLKDRGLTVTDSIELLPSAALGGKIFGLVNNSVANIRSDPRHSGELATQALLGTPLNVLKQSGEWYLVQTPDKYISWVDHGGLVVLDKAGFETWKSAEKIIYTRVAGFSYKAGNETAQPVSDLVMGCVLELVSEEKDFYQVKYPDGRGAFVSKKEAKPVDGWLAQANPTGENLTNIAFQLMGAPYLWGGTSTKGMDCSGFTKTVYFMNGLVIPRDASQQVHAGQPVQSEQPFGQLEVGDLLFFGTPATPEKKERVVHVGMWIGDKKFIHASGQVRVSSVDPGNELYDEYNVNRFLRARRYAPNFEGSILEMKNEVLF